MNKSESKLVNLCSLLYSNQCCHQIIVDWFLSKECVTHIISKTLGYGIIAGSTLVKMPQIIKIFNAKSGRGISFVGVLLELIAMTFSASYAFANSFPFSSWGESLFLMFVTAIIGFLILSYEYSNWCSISFVFTYLSLIYLLMSGLTPMAILWSLQAVNLPLTIFGKLIQAFTNYKNGHTGQLSAITAWLLFLGAMVRIFTSIHETGDHLVVMTFLCASLANFVIVYQIMYYWNQTNQYLQTLTKKKL